MKKLKYSKPDPAGSERAILAKQQRDLATEISRLQPQAQTQANGEEGDHGPQYPANFTKGLAHDDNGLLECPEDYWTFVEAINSSDRTLFDTHVQSAEDRGKAFACSINNQPTQWRGWESPRAGHAFELEGPDSGALGMAPAPRVGSSELAAEMAEVYALSILRDVPFTEIADGGDKKLCDSWSVQVESWRQPASTLMILTIAIYCYPWLFREAKHCISSCLALYNKSATVSAPSSSSLSVKNAEVSNK